MYNWILLETDLSTRYFLCSTIQTILIECQRQSRLFPVWKQVQISVSVLSENIGKNLFLTPFSSTLTDAQCRRIDITTWVAECCYWLLLLLYRASIEKSKESICNSWLSQSRLLLSLIIYFYSISNHINSIIIYPVSICTIRPEYTTQINIIYQLYPKKAIIFSRKSIYIRVQNSKMNADQIIHLFKQSVSLPLFLLLFKHFDYKYFSSFVSPDDSQLVLNYPTEII